MPPVAWIVAATIPALLLPPVLPRTALGVLAPGALLLAWAAGRRRRGRRAADLSLLLFFPLAAAAWSAVRPQPLALPEGLPTLWIRATAAIRGTEGGVEEVQIGTAGGWAPIGGRFLARAEEIPVGPFVARGRLVPLGGRGVPGLADPDLEARQAGYRGRLMVEAAWEAGQPADPLPGSRRALRSWLPSRLGSTLPAPLKSVLGRAVWGDRTPLEPHLARLFQATGTMHLLAISGLHVSLLILSIDLLLGLFLRPRGLRLAAVLSWILFYVWLVGPHPSVVRSSAMGALILAGRACGRPVAGGVAWWVALGLLGVWAPEDLLSAGGLLSFGATAALLLRPEPVAGLRAPAASAAVTAATAGILWGWFGEAAPLAVGANLVALPLFGPLLVSSLWGLAWGDPASGLLQALAWGPTRLLWSALSGLLAALAPLGEATMLRYSCGPAVGVAATGGALALLAIARGVRSRIAGTLLFLAALALPVAAAEVAQRAASRPGGSLEAIVLPVGQGDSILLRCRSGRAYLVDTGPGGVGGELGRRRLAPALRASGVERIHGLFLTHGDEDHVGGLHGLLAAGIAVDTLYLSAADDYTLSLPRGRVPPVRILSLVWRRTEPECAITLLSPTANGGEERGNEGSLVLRIDAPGASLLLPGDLGEKGEGRLLARGIEPVEILLAGHHGSAGSSGRPWLARLRPRVVLASCGRGNRYGHPAPSLRARVSEAEARFFRTDRDGAIRIRWRDGRAEIRSSGCDAWSPVL